MTRKVFHAAFGLALATGLSACSDGDGATSALDPSFSTSSRPELVECPTDVSYETSGTVQPLGGSVTLRGHAVNVPLGAVLTPTTIGLAEPASQYMMIELSANGQDHYQFEAPLSITISYERCSRSNIDKAPLQVWLVDETTGALLQNMGGIDDKEARTITFETDHFSGYAIAN